MSRIIRTATIQARVLPTTKEASERILWCIGLNMSEAIELFLRRIIMDGRIPFEVAAMNTDTLATFDSASQQDLKTGAIVKGKTGNQSNLQQRGFEVLPRKKLKSFSGRVIDSVKRSGNQSGN